MIHTCARDDVSERSLTCRPRERRDRRLHDEIKFRLLGGGGEDSSMGEGLTHTFTLYKTLTLNGPRPLLLFLIFRVPTHAQDISNSSASYTRAPSYKTTLSPSKGRVQRDGEGEGGAYRDHTVLSAIDIRPLRALDTK